MTKRRARTMTRSCIYSSLEAWITKHIEAWIDANINYVDDPFWVINGETQSVDIYYHWMGQSDCVTATLDEIVKGG